MKNRTAASATPPASRRRFLRGGLLATTAVLAGPALLSACGGSGDIVSALRPSRFIVLGDGLSYLGASRYTVNDGSTNIWALQLAGRYNLSVADVGSGGAGYAQGGAVVSGAAPSIEAQVGAFLGAGTPGANDVVLINIPMAGVVSAMAAVKAATQTQAQALATLKAEGKAFAAQVHRLVTGGVKYLLVAGVYDMGKSPLAIAQAQQAAFTEAAQQINDGFKTDASDLGANVLFVDTASYINLLVENPGGYGLTNATAAVCLADPATSCTAASGDLVAGADPALYLFADQTHPTPAAHRLFGNHAYDQIVKRW